MASSVARLKLMGGGDFDQKLIGKKGKRRPVKKDQDFADSLFPTYTRPSTAPSIDYTSPPSWLGMHSPKQRVVTMHEKTKRAVHKALFIANIVDLEQLAENEEKRIDEKNKKNEEPGFFQKMYSQVEDKLIREATEEERRMLVGGHAFQVTAIKNNSSYEKVRTLLISARYSVGWDLMTRSLFVSAFRLHPVYFAGLVHQRTL
jgi:hypothetical protein